MRWRPPAQPISMPSMHEALGMHARADAGFVEHRDHALLEHARADATEHVLAGVPLEDHVVDSRALQQLSQQETRTGPAPMMATWCVSAR